MNLCSVNWIGSGGSVILTILPVVFYGDLQVNEIIAKACRKWFVSAIQWGNGARPF